MQQYITKRVLLFIPTLVLVTVLVFFLLRVLPGDPAIQILSAGGEVSFTDEDLASMRHELGIDRPAYVQYADWVWGLLRGDLGTTLFYRRPVSEEISPRLPISFELAILAWVISAVVAVPLGIISAIKQDTPLDYIARAFTLVGISVPIFVTGIVSIYLLDRVFGWFPPFGSGYVSLWRDPWTNFQQIIFPALTLAFFQANFTARVTRSAMLEVLREDYVRTARAKGLSEWVIINVHALKNAFLPIIGVSGWAFAVLLGGSVIIERIFVVPGLGTLLIDSILQRDYTLVQTLVLVFGISVLTVNLLVDLVYAWFDPRIRYG